MKFNFMIMNKITNLAYIPNGRHEAGVRTATKTPEANTAPRKVALTAICKKKYTN
jgi:hypothetical protein